GQPARPAARAPGVQGLLRLREARGRADLRHDRQALRGLADRAIRQRSARHHGGTHPGNCGHGQRSGHQRGGPPPRASSVSQSVGSRRKLVSDRKPGLSDAHGLCFVALGRGPCAGRPRMISRRHLLISGAITLAVAGLGVAFFGRSAAEEHIASAVRSRLGFLKLDEAGLREFAKDQVGALLAKRPTWNRLKYHFLKLFTRSFSKYYHSND